MTELAVGAKVRLCPREAGGHVEGARLRGGEGTIVSIVEDSKGTCYGVQLRHTERIRYARRDDLVAHRNNNNRRTK